MLIQKKLIILFLVSFLFSWSGYSQDTIRLQTKEIIIAKVIEVGTKEIKYKKSNNLDGPLYSVKKNVVDFIIYSNNFKEVYEKAMPATEKAAEITENDSKTSNAESVKITELQTQFETKTLKDSYILYLTNGEKIKAKIVKVTSERITYRSPSFLNGPMYYCNINEVANVEPVSE
jgi:hypothetical protein